MEQMFLVHGATRHALRVDNNRHKGCPPRCYTDTTLTFSLLYSSLMWMEQHGRTGVQGFWKAHQASSSKREKEK